MRRIAAASVVLLLVACSGGAGGGGDDAAPVVSPAATVAADARAPSESGDEIDVTSSEASDASDAEPAARAVRVSVRSDSVDGELVVEQTGDGDPFATFGSCSGLRSRVGTYSVLVSDTIGPVRSVSLLTVGAVGGTGTFDADVRIEPAVGDPIIATGTVTLATDLTSGSFLVFALDGEPIEGDFECTGSPGPRPLDLGSDDGTLDAIEVFALLRRGDAERVLGLAVTADSAPGSECPGADGGSDETSIVRVDGDGSIGAITTFELTGGATPTMRLRAGGVVYEFDRVDVQLDDDAVSGTFSAVTPSGIAVDGAFRCV